jgi:hypothetical protein
MAMSSSESDFATGSCLQNDAPAVALSRICFAPRPLRYPGAPCVNPWRCRAPGPAGAAALPCQRGSAAPTHWLVVVSKAIALTRPKYGESARGRMVKPMAPSESMRARLHPAPGLASTSTRPDVGCKRGAARASGRLSPPSTKRLTVWVTAEIMRRAPAAPRTRSGRPSRTTISGDWEDQWRRVPGSSSPR